MGNQLKPEEIHGKKIIAVAGYDIFGKQLINTVNKEVMQKNLLVIGINIQEDDFGFFIHNLADSKVEITIFLPEYQEKVASFYKKDGAVIAVYKVDDKLKYLVEDTKLNIDDTKLLEIINKIEKDL